MEEIAEEEMTLLKNVRDYARKQLSQRGLSGASVGIYQDERTSVPLVRVSTFRDGDRYGFEIAVQYTEHEIDVYEYQVDRSIDLLVAELPD